MRNKKNPAAAVPSGNCSSSSTGEALLHMRHVGKAKLCLRTYDAAPPGNSSSVWRSQAAGLHLPVCFAGGPAAGACAVSRDFEMMAEADGQRGPVSFGFSRTVSKVRVKEAELTNDQEAVSSLEQGEILGVKPRVKPQELVIPLIRKTRWHRPDPGQRDTEGEPVREREDSDIEVRAVEELIEDSQRLQQKWSEVSRQESALSIPLLKQNQAPGGYEDGDKINVELRPDSSTDADYEAVPVDAYGLAMLRGMGWKKGEGIGRTFKQDVKPLEHQLRPKGLGLGADRSALQGLEAPVPKRALKPGEERKVEQPTGLAVGSLVQIEKAPHQDMYGKIEGLDPDNARVLVKLAVGGKVVTVSQYTVRFVEAEEYDKYSKDLSRLSKAHKDSQQREAERAAGNAKPPERQGKDGERGSSKERRREECERRDRKRKHEGSSDRAAHSNKDYKTSNGTSAVVNRDSCWLRTDLFVRFIDKRFKGGKYYNSKVTIEDVLDYDSCVCRTEDGRLLEGIKQSMLETVIPKKDSDHIMVVLGRHKGQVGRILQRDKEQCRAIVQLQRGDEPVLKLAYDAICQYVGGTDDD
ncbi:G-patch domain and KOW motifs-containing protein [Rhincodon typus]|uniref:G-patch domain and KOW motifs-containing protein n=1 Tax=Rhincodon typus TaxID=259920 RepID=UPI00202DEAA2|nr:G-patch domain and KOW motifs-containing protein [Rhincodon typus]